MPPLTTPETIPEKLKPYTFHGMDLTWRGKSQGIGTCPFCQKEGKFHVGIENGQWDCKSCGKQGNLYGFLRHLWEVSEGQTEEHEALAKNRKLLFTQTLEEWGVVSSAISGEMLVPGYGVTGALNALSPYRAPHSGGKPFLWNTPTTSPQLFGQPLYDDKKEKVYLCEGPWDAMALYEVLRITRKTDSGYAITSREDLSLYAEANILAAPGAGTVRDDWAPLFAGKTVYLCFDSDPPPANGQVPAGYAGMQKFAKMLLSSETTPKEIHYLWWGPNGYLPDAKTKLDIRDLLTTTSSAAERVAILASQLLPRFRPIPNDWIDGADPTSKLGCPQMACVPCSEWDKVENSWRKALKWIPGLRRALVSMLATVTSTPGIGDQLWMKIIGPPSCGKTVLCEAVSIARKWVEAQSIIRGFHSGYQTDKEGKEDHSLLPKLRGKTLITKDGDTLLQSPNVLQILAEARDAYDKKSRSSYRNKASRKYEGYNWTWILCGTEALRFLDTSELGERFIDCRIMSDIDDTLEVDICRRKFLEVRNNRGMQANGKAETQQNPRMTEAMQLTGGYVEHLRANGVELQSEIDVSDDVGELCISYGRFMSYMRARPSKKQDEGNSREIAARLVSQISRYAICAAVVLNKREVEEEVLSLAKQIALDTSKGRTFRITQAIYNTGVSGADVASLAILVMEDEKKLKEYLNFLKQIKAVEHYQHTTPGMMGSKPRWRLTAPLRTLFGEVQP